MKIIQRTLTEKESEKRDYRDALQIEIDGKVVFEVWDGESEDNNLMRNFNDCLSIISMLKLVHKAGLNGEELEFEFLEEDEF